MSDDSMMLREVNGRLEAVPLEDCPEKYDTFALTWLDQEFLAACRIKLPI